MPFVEHALVALAIQVAVGLWTRNWWAGAAVACSYFIGRELAQAEYRWIEGFGEGLRGNMPWWGAFDLRVWNTAERWADIAGPVVATGTLAFIMHRRSARR